MSRAAASDVRARAAHGAAVMRGALEGLVPASIVHRLRLRAIERPLQRDAELVAAFDQAVWIGRPRRPRRWGLLAVLALFVVLAATTHGSWRPAGSGMCRTVMSGIVPGAGLEAPQQPRRRHARVGGSCPWRAQAPAR